MQIMKHDIEKTFGGSSYSSYYSTYSTWVIIHVVFVSCCSSCDLTHYLVRVN